MGTDKKMPELSAIYFFWLMQHFTYLQYLDAALKMVL